MKRLVRGFASAGGHFLATSLLAIGLATTLAAAAPDRQARHRAAEFVRITGVAAGEMPVARWIDPVCPRVLGLRENAARAAERKMRRIAAEAGIEVAGANCNTNIVVSFVPDASAVAQEISRLAPMRLADLSPQAREALLTGSAPIRWWHESELRGREGETLQQPGAMIATQPSTSLGTGAGGSISGAAMMQYNSSLISTMSQRALTAATVIVDQNAVLGMPLDFVASYAALVAFAEIRQADADPRGSILRQVTARRLPRDPTAQDMAFLRALYRIPMDRRAMLHRSALVSEMATASVE